METETEVILRSVQQNIERLRDFLTPEQQRRFLEYWRPIANAADMTAFDLAVERFRYRFCAKISGIADLLPELNAPVSDLGDPPVIAPYPVQPVERLLPLGNRLIIARDILCHFEEPRQDINDSPRHEEDRQNYADSAA